MKLGNPKLLAVLALLIAVVLVAWLNRPLPIGPRPHAQSAPLELPETAMPGATAQAPKPRDPVPVAPKAEPPSVRGAAAPSVDLPSGPNKYAPEITYSAQEYREAKNGPQLADCGASKDPDNLCVYTQPRFLTDWGKARDGDIDAARRIALCVGGGCNGAVKPTPVEGCAWSILIDRTRRGLDETDRAYVTMNCSGLDRGGQAAAQQRASEISQDVHLRDAG